MNQTPLRITLRLLLTFIVGLLITAAAYFAVKAGQISVEPLSKTRIVCDSFFVSAIALISFGGLCAISSFGGFNGISYGFYRLGCRFKFRKNSSESNQTMSYFDYVQEKNKKPTNWYFVYPLSTGTAFAIISALILIAV